MDLVHLACEDDLLWVVVDSFFAVASGGMVGS